MSDKLISSIKKYLDDEYGDLECLESYSQVTWYKNEKPIAGVTRENTVRLKLSPTEFNMFLGFFSLPWKTQEDDIFLLELIIPYLKFNGGSPAIPVLINIGFIEELTEIGLPSDW